ncbi:MAG: C2 family cysteine protease, partial [Planctomycetota bacterium]|nr:C2 family cysteine protease [Planctomycetota bacterium]
MRPFAFDVPAMFELEPRLLLSGVGSDVLLPVGCPSTMTGPCCSQVQAGPAPAAAQSPAWADAWRGDTIRAYRQIASWQKQTQTTTQTQTSGAAGAYTPGTQVSWRVENVSGGSQLVVLGTDAADSVTVSKNGTATVIYVSGILAWTTSQVFSSVALYGFGGDDTLVSISGAAETVYGGAGMDSFWGDSGDKIADAESAETAGGNVHVVTQFFSSASVAQPSLQLAGQKLADPAAGYSYANFSSRRVFVDGPQYNDIRQGGLGDCYFLAALASLAQTDPGVIRQMVVALGDGTFAVRFFSGGQAKYVRVDGDLPVYTGTYLAYANLSPSGELWAALAEKAYAQFRTGANSYASISGGWMSPVYTQVTGVSAGDTYTSSAAASTLASQISQALAAGHAVTAGSLSSGSATIVGGHAYMVRSVQVVNGQQMVTVYNPWGVDGKGSDGNA